MKFFMILFYSLLGLFSVMDADDSPYQACRQHVTNWTNGNPQVLNQLDLLLHSLDCVAPSWHGCSENESERIIDAINFATEKHRLQLRKDLLQTPYIVHPLGVANHLITIGDVHDSDIIIAALLHDTVEDTETTFAEIEQRFGSRVVGFVREVTDDKSLPKQLRKQLQIEKAHLKSAEAAQIKLADKLYNLRDLIRGVPMGWEETRVDGYFQWAKAVVDQLPFVNEALKQAVDEVIQEYWDGKIQSPAD